VLVAKNKKIRNLKIHIFSQQTCFLHLQWPKTLPNNWGFFSQTLDGRILAAVGFLILRNARMGLRVASRIGGLENPQTVSKISRLESRNSNGVLWKFSLNTDR